MEIKLKETEEKQVAYIFYTGPVEDMGDLIGEIADWMMEQKVEITGPPYSAYYKVRLKLPLKICSTN